LKTGVKLKKLKVEGQLGSKLKISKTKDQDEKHIEIKGSF
jgi:hypothetical protein